MGAVGWAQHGFTQLLVKVRNLLFHVKTLTIRVSFAEDNREHLRIYTQVFINIYKIFSKTQRLLFATQLGGG